MTYDFDDHLIREMVDRDHRPMEFAYSACRCCQQPKTEHRRVICAHCAQPWPCDAITEFRAWHKNRTIKDAAAMVSYPAHLLP